MNLAGIIKKYKNSIFPFLQIKKNYKYSTSFQIESNVKINQNLNLTRPELQEEKEVAKVL